MKYGHFDDSAREYVIENPKTPVKWINYVGSLHFGGFVDHTGGLLLCKGDPALNRITKYIPQLPSSQLKGHTLYLRLRTPQGLRTLSPLFVPGLQKLDRYECRVGLGYSKFVSELEGIRLELTLFVPTGSEVLVEDVKLKAELREKLKAAGVSSVEIERPGNKLRFLIRTARPGIVIGRKGAEIEKLKTELGKRTNRDVFIDIIEVNKPELDAQLVAENIALQLEKRVSFRRAMRKSVDSALRFGCKGIKVRVSGRLNGNEIARSEWYLQGRLPLHTLRADIDYGFAEANTTYGVIGVKTWIYRGDIYEQKRRQTPAATGSGVF